MKFAYLMRTKSAPKLDYPSNPDFQIIGTKANYPNTVLTIIKMSPNSLKKRFTFGTSSFVLSKKWGSKSHLGNVDRECKTVAV
jgi:hypothetical protein